MIEDSKEYDVKRLQQLLDAIADDSLTDEGEKELQVILKGSKEARKTYLEFTHMIDSLHWSYAENSVAIEDLQAPKVQDGQQEKKPVKFPLWNLVAIAAILTISFTAFYNLSASDESIGQFSASNDTIFNINTKQGRIDQGLIDMESGKATLVLDSGAIIEMSGRVKLELISSMRARLLEGSVTIEAPDSAMGFRLETKASDFVDIGTKFEVSIEDNASKIKVIDGTVIARPNNGGNIIPLNKNEEGTIDAVYGDIVQFNILEASGDGLFIPRDFKKYSPLPANSKVIFIGDRNTDLETYIHMANQAIYDWNPVKVPALINAGMTCRLKFQEEEFKNLIVDKNPTHAVLAFGAEIAAQHGEKLKYRIPLDEYADDMRRMCDKLEENNIQPIILLPFHQVTSQKDCMETLDSYNEIQRALAEERGYRVAEANLLYDELYKRGEHAKLVSASETFLSYEGSKVMAKAVLQVFGYPDLEVPEKLRLSEAPGLIKDWQYFKYTSKYAPEPDLTKLGQRKWRQLTLPLSPFGEIDKRALLPHQGYQYQARSLGVAIGLNAHWQKTVAKSTVHSEAEKQVYLNIGGDTKEVYLNGEKVVHNEGIYSNGRHIGLFRMPITLKKGDNSLVVKSGASFFVSITEHKDWALPLPLSQTVHAEE